MFSDVIVFTGVASRGAAGVDAGSREGEAMKGELRKDPATGKWVLVRRPGVRPWDEREGCPFCPGNERLTPAEIAAYRPAGSRANEPGWQVRVIPEGDPYFMIEEELV